MDALLLLTIKIVVSATMVVVITLVAEKGNPRLAGVLMGFPLGAGLALFFLGVEQGPAFASQSALWSIPGTLSMLSFCLGYRLCNAFYAAKSILVIALCTLSGLTCYFLSAYLLLYFLPETWVRFVVFVIFIPLFALLLGKKTATTIKKPPLTASNRKVVLIARAAFASAIIIIVTTIAKSVGPVWSGVFATFPTTILPSVLILHRRYADTFVPNLFKETTFGILAIVVFAIAVHFFFPPCGPYLGVLLAYTTSFIYLFLYERYIRYPLIKLFRIS